MPNIKPVSNLRNYNEVLKDVTPGDPVFLTRNGRGCYVVLDIKEYEKAKAYEKLMSELESGETSVKESGMLNVQKVFEEKAVK